MITIGYLSSPETSEITNPLSESPLRGFNAFRIYTSNHYAVDSISDTRVVVRHIKPDAIHQLVAFDGPEAEMADIVALANEKLERRREIASSLILVDAPNIDDIWR